MNIALHYLPTTVNAWDVTRALAEVLHSDEFHPVHENERPLNFKVELNPSKMGGVRNDGTGILQLPTEAIGRKFLGWAKETPIRIENKKIRVYPKGHARNYVALTLQRTPFVNPDIEEEWEDKCRQLDLRIRIDAVQFGAYYRPSYPTSPKQRLASRAYSIEWERDYAMNSAAWLKFEYKHKLIRITLGNETTENEGQTIAISFSSINKIAIGYDGKPYICFDTITPPVFEAIELHRSLTGDDRMDNRKYKHRIDSLHPGHASIAPYAQHLRLLLYNDPNCDVIETFKNLCAVAGIATNLIISFTRPWNLEASKQGFFEQKRLWKLRKHIQAFSWPIAFQLELLLHNCLLLTPDVEALIPLVKEACRQHPSQNDDYVGSLLRSYVEALDNRDARESPLNCFNRVKREFLYHKQKLSSGHFLCCHVTFSPTRIILEGPYATQSNRIIRKYAGYDDHFIRVDFRDEDRLSYRWDRAVDGASFVRKRVGDTLKQGFELGGRNFEFLAYSSSALREHAVWFINPFRYQDPDTKDIIHVDAEYIRQSIGDFKGTELMTQPSKWAARIGQAFTATDPSVKVKRHEWTEMPDMGTKENLAKGQYLHTDGAGTISKSLGDEIWACLCKGRRDHGEKAVQPSVYQIRFMGYKGVVAVDPELDHDPNGIRMKLRPTMRKFEDPRSTEADIEIARAFDRPNTSYLNRPLVMILEDKQVRRDSLQELQDNAVADILTADDSMASFIAILKDHSLGSQYRLSYILEKISALGFDLHPQGRTPSIDTPFLEQLRQVTKIDLLREIKHSARIKIPESYLLVGVPDEGPAYEQNGYKDVFTLKQNEIYACVQKHPGEEPEWIVGPCTISRSPVVHPGDIQQVIGVKPKDNMFCAFRHIRNAVVLPSVGERSLASKLGGGDLDGDIYDVIPNSDLIPPVINEAASYASAGTYVARDENGEPRECDVNDIADFIVEYINSDVLGLLSDRLLVIADQSSEGIYDKDCEWLAGLCAQAVDYPKQGIPVDIDDDNLPRTLIRCKPDWHAAEVVDPRSTDYYESTRALGHMFRSIKWTNPEALPSDTPTSGKHLSTDPLSKALQTYIQHQIWPYIEPDGMSPETASLFRQYESELRYISATHTLSNTPGIRLLEAEIVVGTILAKCTQKRWRKDRTWRMRGHASQLMKDVKQGLMRLTDVQLELKEVIPTETYRDALERAWLAWDYSLRHSDEFGAKSFGLIVLGVIFECLEKLNVDINPASA
ncbi:RNA dependent RNA polymerase-domain-containing protein [Desarmillaria tabescens]|uniref:RNA-dependent RNA polymerase n=1 Tax=Armillaria tabescens TaxID=1929756 RepID=A0AA39NDR8_ARMTA|nr:RNA dependent RNA polymerase-domain-containing protein [Desarmillaria tabescens]KAK0463788.1 RNA dependent RNA polymerase-domain-containing protein [Desarmillaria tabescens]